jgi:hypothetical protein
MSGSSYDVFTTNYDRVIEEFCAASTEASLIDGFVQVEKRRLWEWDPVIFDAARTVRPGIDFNIALYKLHGSLNWRRTTNGKVEQVRPEEPIGAGGGNSFAENVLIYPGGKAQPTIEPFQWLYKAFVQRIRTATTCLVIGFSFRDEYLNLAFAEFVERTKTKLIVVSPSAAKNVQDNLLRERSLELLKDKGKLITINKPFEEAIKNELSKVL